MLARQVITPFDLQATYGLTGGHIFQGELALDQLLVGRPTLGWGRHETPIRGLFLGGAGTHPGRRAGRPLRLAGGEGRPARNRQIKPTLPAGISSNLEAVLSHQGAVMLTRAAVFACACLIATPLQAQIAIDQGIQIMRAPGGLPPRDGQPARVGTARITGRVVAADSGQPIRRAVVRVTAAEIRENRSTVTDAEGRYEIKELPAARYIVNASKGSFVALSHGQTRPFDSGRPLEVKDGQTVERIDFRLPRGAVIAGRVLDEMGEPVADVQVMTMRSQFVQGRRQPAPYGRPAMTNDIGEFRLYGLPPGDYYISATARDLAAMMATSDDRSGYAPTYYPGTPNAGEAQLVSVAIGESKNDLTLALVPVKTGRITGTALDGEGKPLRGGNVMLSQTMRGGGDMTMMFMNASGSTIKPDGSFMVSGVAPGEYQLRAMAVGAGPGTAEASVATVTVAGGEDINGVVLMPQRPATAQGRISVTPPDTTGKLAPSDVRLMATPVVPERSDVHGRGTPPTVRADWSFEMQITPGS